MFQDRVIAVGATKFAVGLSQIIRVLPGPNVSNMFLKIAAGGGTLEIVAPNYSGASTPAPAAGASIWTSGYAVGGTEIYKADGNAAFYLVATGATMTVSMAINYSAGVTLY